MNWQHFQTLLWLRWRLRVNQFRRAGTVNAVILILVTVAVLSLAVVLFVALLLVGLFALSTVTPMVLLYVWDGLVVAFLFSWGITTMVLLAIVISKAPPPPEKRTFGLE